MFSQQLIYLQKREILHHAKISYYMVVGTQLQGPPLLGGVMHGGMVSWAAGYNEALCGSDKEAKGMDAYLWLMVHVCCAIQMTT